MKIAVVFTKRINMPTHYRLDWEGRNKNDDAEAAVKALKKLGHEVFEYDVNLGLFEKLRANKDNIELVFNLCDDGFFDNAELEPHLPAMLDILKMPYTGGDYFTLAVTLKKDIAKKILISHGLPTPKFQIFRNGSENIEKLNFPLIVKPAHEDGSIGVRESSIVYDVDALKKMINHVIRQYKQPALAEEFIDGREFNVAIIGDEEVLPINEIKFDLPEGKPKIISYEAKWKTDSIEYNGTKRSCPADVDKKLAMQLRTLAIKAGYLFGCRDYFRVDFRVDENNNPFILEVNQNPDISEEDGGLYEMAKTKGYSYADMIDKIVRNAVKRRA